jgi:DmsE family decaheme c-type cytochrome
MPVHTKEECAPCHEDQVASFDRTAHARSWPAGQMDCEHCHGDATAHIEAGGGVETMISLTKDLSPTEASKVCLNCHEKSGEQSHVSLSEHTKAGVSCVQCHNVHPEQSDKVEAGKHGRGSMLPPNRLEFCLGCHSNIAAEISMPSRHRMKEGAMDCSSCHNVHGSLQRRQVRAETRDQCLSCHTDKRGPFMFGHEVINLEGCTACHSPHGSPAKNMLKERDQRALCLSCHSADMGKGVPHGRASTTTMGDCTRCHSAVHGSNVDPFLLH